MIVRIGSKNNPCEINSSWAGTLVTADLDGKHIGQNILSECFNSFIIRQNFSRKRKRRDFFSIFEDGRGINQSKKGTYLTNYTRLEKTRILSILILTHV